MDLLLFGFIAQTIGSFLLLGGYFPQIAKLHKTKNPTGISGLFWLMIAVGCTTILVNMIIKDTSTYIVVTQAFNSLLAWYTLGLVLYCRKLNGIKSKFGKNEVVLSLVGLFLIIASFEQYSKGTDELGSFLQLVGTGALLLAYVPQIIYLYKVKNADGISKWLYIALAVGLSLLTVNYIITDTSIGIIVTEVLNIALILIQLALTIYYQNKNN